MAAWRLAAAGHEVTALEQFRIDHDRGSSYGDSRIVRRVYHAQLYTEMMAEAYRLWDELMARSGVRDLFVRSGGIYFGPADHADVVAAEAALRASGVPYERLDAAECARRFPAVRLDAAEVALFEPSMGYARASRAVRAAVKLARGGGATVREETPVAAIESAPAGVRVRLATGEILMADWLLISSGPWSESLLKTLGVALPLTVTRQPYIHLTPLHDEDSFLPGVFPVWIDAAANTYGFPRLGDVPGVKIGIHDFGLASSPDCSIVSNTPGVTPVKSPPIDRTVHETDREAVRAYARRRFPALGTVTAYEKVCLYTVTPDQHFIIDSVPGMPRITLISACSGHGFKFTPLLGQIAADLVSESGALRDLSTFRLSRFAGNN
jgi:sarcosine oxidase